MNCGLKRLHEDLEVITVSVTPTSSTGTGCTAWKACAQDLMVSEQIQHKLQAEACRLFALRERLLELSGTSEVLRVLSDTCSLQYLHVFVEKHALSTLLSRALINIDLCAVATDVLLETVLDDITSRSTCTPYKTFISTATTLDFEAQAQALCNEPLYTVDEAFFKLETLEATIAVICSKDIAQLEAAMVAAVVRRDAFGLLLLLTAEEHSDTLQVQAFFSYTGTVIYRISCTPNSKVD